MKPPSFDKVVIGSSGLVGIAVGILGLLVPVSFHASSGIDIGGQVDLLSELRGTGGSILALGAFVLVGAFLPGLRRVAGIVSALLYLGYASSRTLSLVLDGRPSNVLVAVMAAEWAIGGLVLLTALRSGQRLVSEAQ